MVNVPPLRPSITDGTGKEFTNLGCVLGSSNCAGNDKLKLMNNMNKLKLEKHFGEVKIFFINVSFELNKKRRMKGSDLKMLMM
jgi:hypothetical protein